MVRTRGGHSTSGVRNVLNPGPIDGSVLYMQSRHRSEDVWRIQDGARQAITFRHHLLWELDARVSPFIIQAGFYGITQIGHIKLDHGLLTALVERWRRETHTFHFRCGEMTVTLQDVAVLLGLRVDGRAVIGHMVEQWDDVMQRLLGRVPPRTERQGASVRLSWLYNNFGPQTPPFDGAGDDVLRQYARAYILAMFGSSLFTSTNGDSISLHYLPLLEDLQHTSTYSWGGAVLAVLYRNLCRACLSGSRGMGGCAMLLQLWSWERLHLCRPKIVRHVVPRPDDPLPPLGAIWGGDRTFRHNPTIVVSFARAELDTQGSQQVVWMPYTQERLMSASFVCIEGSHIWASVVPLICYEIVERHCPDRVMRQFGLSQHIPEAVDTGATLHELSRRGRSDVNWIDENAAWVHQWDQRHDLVVQERIDNLSNNDYMRWYTSITRLFVSPPTDIPITPQLEYEPHMSRLHRIAHLATEGARMASNAMTNSISNATSGIAHGWFITCRDILHELGEEHRLHQPTVQLGLRRGRRGREGRPRMRGWASSSHHSQDNTSPSIALDPSSAPAPSSTPNEWNPITRRRTGV